ncbi:serine hydrolase [Catelliglobosispora koreensis]|uniref:serine hydrolase n=1 Tax=Catelliglobosispora koreensis TaxID=129052 RepID=UPI00036FF843|nr:serine hydrolase [Catelliglobosispora koreensis]
MRLNKLINAGLTLALTAGIVAGTATSASAATVTDPERYSATPTGFGWYFSASKATINSWANQYNMRITNIEVNGPDNFTATLVHNSGVYQRGLSGSSSWTTDETVDTMLAKLAGKRLLDLERYVVNGQTRFAAAWVDNPAGNWHDYRWYINSTESFINQKQADFNGRIIDIDHVSADRYDVVMVPNTGVDYKDSKVVFGKTMVEIGNIIALDYRVVDIERHADGKWSAVLVKNDQAYWSWHPNLSGQQVLDMQADKGLRPIHLKSFVQNGETRYSVIFVDNLDTVSIKARDAIEDGVGHSSATRGFYLKAVDGGVYNWLGGDTKFEPASMLKALHHIHAMRQVYLGNDSLADGVTWYKNPAGPNNGGWCAYEDDGDPITTLPVNDTLENTLKGMMEQSDNRKTDAIYNLYGPNALNTTADALGMTNTQLNHRIGCTWEAAGQVKASNELTLVDAGKLYESVYRASNPYLGTGEARTKFTELASDGTSIFSAVMKEEAAALGLTIAQRDEFATQMWGAFKPGGYANGTPTAVCDATGCTELLMRSTGGGMLSIPVKGITGRISEKKFVYGAFIDGVFDCGTGADKDCSQESAAMWPAVQASMAEMMRPHLKAALATFK